MNYFDHNAAQQGMPAHRDAPRENIPAPVDPMAALIRAHLEARARGCTCREYIGNYLKIEPDCPVHQEW